MKKDRKARENNSPKELCLHKADSSHSELFRIEIGFNAYKNGRNDYGRRVGYIFYCDECCNDFRVQFFEMGNSELLRSFDLDRCRFFMANNYSLPPVKSRLKI